MEFWTRIILIFSECALQRCHNFCFQRSTVHIQEASGCKIQDYRPFLGERSNQANQIHRVSAVAAEGLA